MPEILLPPFDYVGYQLPLILIPFKEYCLELQKISRFLLQIYVMFLFSPNFILLFNLFHFFLTYPGDFLLLKNPYLYLVSIHYSLLGSMPGS